MSKLFGKIQIKQQECKGCNLCIKECPCKVLDLSQDLNDSGYRYCVVKKPESYIGCGICYYSCPEPGTISVCQYKLEE